MSLARSAVVQWQPVHTCRAWMHIEAHLSHISLADLGGRGRDPSIRAAQALLRASAAVRFLRRGPYPRRRRNELRLRRVLRMGEAHICGNALEVTANDLGHHRLFRSGPRQG